jgi:hypothetical protein
MFILYTGDLNPIGTVPMLGTHKARMINCSDSFRFSMLHSRFNLNPATNALRRHCGTSA